MKPIRHSCRYALLTLFALLCCSSSAAFAGDATLPWRISAQPFGLLSMPELIKPPPPEKKWFAKLTAGYQYDSNVILNAPGVPIPAGIGKKDDSRLVFNLSGSYLPIKGTKGDLALNYAFFQSQHLDLDDFNLTQNIAEIAGRYKIDDRYTLRYSALFQHLLLGGELFDYAFMTGPTLIINAQKGQSTVVDLRYRSTEYANVAIFTRNTIRSGSNYMGAITQNFFLSPHALLRIGYAGDVDKTRSPLWDGVGHKVNIEGSFILPADSLLDLYGEYYRKDYEGIYASIGEKREDRAWSTVVTLTTYFAERYGLSLRALYTRNLSNVPSFDLSRVITGILFDVRF